VGSEAAKLGPIARRTLAVRPGITGLWSFSRRSLSWEESVRLDLRYVEYRSFVLDVEILWKAFSEAGRRLVRERRRYRARRRPW
jgi:lipopolysaccharide/colanic/teichoic acid biosynthesis glycosyltransferase